jgi:acetyltransferase
VIGASARESSVGYAVLRNLLWGGAGSTERKRGFAGEIFAVNPKGGDILGAKAYPSLSAIGKPVDLIVVAIPPVHIVPLMDEAGALGVTAAIIISAGFAEMGADGKALQDQMVTAARRHGMRLIGPNCLGVIRPSTGLNASFGAGAPPALKTKLQGQAEKVWTDLAGDVYSKAELEMVLKYRAEFRAKKK